MVIPAPSNGEDGAESQAEEEGREWGERPSAPTLVEDWGGGDGSRSQRIGRKDSVPPIFVCPITQEFMRDPCIAEDGYTYEREAIERWAAKSDRSPMSNQKMKTLRVIPNHALRSAIREWQTNHGPQEETAQGT